MTHRYIEYRNLKLVLLFTIYSNLLSIILKYYSSNISCFSHQPHIIHSKIHLRVCLCRKRNMDIEFEINRTAIIDLEC